MNRTTEFPLRDGDLDTFNLNSSVSKRRRCGDLGGGGLVIGDDDDDDVLPVLGGVKGGCDVGARDDGDNGVG